MKSSSGFAYNGLTVRVEADEPAVLRWLEEFLTPAFTRVDGLAADCTVVLDVDDAEYHDTLEQGPRSDASPVDCFTLDTGIVRLPPWRSAHPGAVVFDEPFRVFYFMHPNGPHIRLLTASENLAARFALMRVVREFAMAHSHTTTSLVIHSAALAVAGRGIIIAGPKGSGKTSLLIYGLHDRRTRFVSNDRVVVDLASTDPVAHGMPTLVTIRAATLQCFPDLHAAVLRDACDHRLSATESERLVGEAKRPGAGDAVDLTPAQFCAFMNTPMVDRSVVRALVFPQVSEDHTGIAFQALAAEAAAARLSAALFAAAASQKISQVFALSSGRRAAPDSAQELCLALTSRLRCFDCRLGQRAYRVAGAGNLLDQFLEPGAA